jgi:5-hydroxyisourate hydrolase
LKLSIVLASFCHNQREQEKEKNGVVQSLQGQPPTLLYHSPLNQSHQHAKLNTNKQTNTKPQQSSVFKKNQPTTMAAAAAATATRPFITCHVLETVSGRPAPNMHVTLSLLSPLPSSSSSSSSASSSSSLPTTFTATTNSDGRVTSWTSTLPHSPGTLSSSCTELNHLVTVLKSNFKNNDNDDNNNNKNQIYWSLVFKTEEFYGRAKTFWPEVDVKFSTRVDETHYHVPLLLGPWSYTTYRGS